MIKKSTVAGSVVGITEEAKLPKEAG